MVTAYIGIGSNLGSKRENINSAIRLLQNNGEVIVEKVSSLIETEPEGDVSQNKFLNGVIQISTKLSAHKLLARLQQIEAQLGRVRAVKNGPRTIDLDILLFGKRFVYYEIIGVLIIFMAIYIGSMKKKDKLEAERA